MNHFQLLRETLWEIGIISSIKWQFYIFFVGELGLKENTNSWKKRDENLGELKILFSFTTLSYSNIT